MSTPDERQELREQLNLYYEKWLHIDNLYNAWSQQFGLSYISLLTLYMVRSGEAATQHGLCQRLYLPKQTASFLLKGLERRQLLRRLPDPADRRNRRLVLTPEGDRFIDQAFALLEQRELEAYRTLSREQRTAVSQGLTLLEEALSQTLREPEKPSSISQREPEQTPRTGCAQDGQAGEGSD